MEHPVVAAITRLARVLLLSLFCCLDLRNTLVTGALQGRVEVFKSSEDGMEVWGYSEVRKGAHMFWWLYYSTHPGGYTTRPLLIWLQGGPGLSSSGLGNFVLMGPLNESLEPRQDTWVKEANVLFVDNPVDVGFSYLDNGTLPAQDTNEIGLDLVNMLHSLFQLLPILKRMPVYIFGQSYGGKMAAAFGYQLQQAIEKNETFAKFKGVAFGNAWISPVDSMVNWAPLMLHMSVLDLYQFQVLNKAARDVEQEVEKCGARCATSRRKWSELQSVSGGDGVNYYNIMQYNHPVYYRNSLVPILMNGQVKEKLAIIPHKISWKNVSRLVYNTAVSNDFLESEVTKVDWLLERDILVVIYQGQLDIMCPTNGAQDWLNKLKWNKFPLFYKNTRLALMPPGGNRPEMFVKAYQNLRFYWVLNSGHSVPKSTPAASRRMVSYIINSEHTGAALYSHCAHLSSSAVFIIFQILTLFYITTKSSS